MVVEKLEIYLFGNHIIKGFTKNTIVIGFDCNIFSVDDLLRAGINKASHLVVVNRENSSDKQCEEVLGDSETIVAVQTIFKYVLTFYMKTF